MTLLHAINLTRDYATRAGLFSRLQSVRAVDGVSLTLTPGRTLGLVGESGCGKSTTGRLVLGLEPPSSGEVRFADAAMPKPGSKQWRQLRARMQMVFQDPLGALDRRMTVAQLVHEPLVIHGMAAGPERTLLVAAAMDAAGIGPDLAPRHPHELSGGQRQRAVIARALVTNHDLLVCDEPVSALDVSIQAQVINRLVDVQQERGIAMLFISHDLKLVRQISHEVAVMYLGRIVEQGAPDAIFTDPLHPYTKALVSAIPSITRRSTPRIVLDGDPPNPANRPSGCAFHPRCREAVASCRVDIPALRPTADGRSVACHLVPSVTVSEAA